MNDCTFKTLASGGFTTSLAWTMAPSRGHKEQICI